MINLKKNFLIYGYGISGKSIENYLINNNCNYNIFDDYKKFKNKNFISKNYLLKNLKEYNYFIVSPSIKIKKDHFLYKLRKKIIIDLDFLSLEISNQKIIGVTGTEGKSTICSYLNQFLSKKYNTKIIGNFGDTILEKKNLQNYLSKIDFLIIELSSYQLDKLKYLQLNYALITNIFIDHIDYHNNLKNYVQTKFRIQNLLKNNSNLYLSSSLFLKYRDYIKINKRRVFLCNNKNFKNSNLIEYFKDINLNSIKKLIHNIDSKIKFGKNITIKELKYRNQLIYVSKNLKIYNDSKCTNLHNAILKINLIKSSKKILILGGKFKKQSNLNFNISNTLVLIFGYHSNLFLKNLSFKNSNFYKFDNLYELINFLNLIIKLHKYNYVLFSPGGESFDSYKNYQERGKHFSKLIKKILF